MVTIVVKNHLTTAQAVELQRLMDQTKADMLAAIAAGLVANSEEAFHRSFVAEESAKEFHAALGEMLGMSNG